MGENTIVPTFPTTSLTPHIRTIVVMDGLRNILRCQIFEFLR